METIYDTETFMEKVSKEGFLNNKEKQYAVLRALEIIGKATKNLSIELKTNHPKIPWKEISGMRNKLIPEYFGINLELVWETIKK